MRKKIFKRFTGLSFFVAFFGLGVVLVSDKANALEAERPTVGERLKHGIKKFQGYQFKDLRSLQHKFFNDLGSNLPKDKKRLLKIQAAWEHTPAAEDLENAHLHFAFGIVAAESRMAQPRFEKEKSPQYQFSHRQALEASKDLLFSVQSDGTYYQKAKDLFKMVRVAQDLFCSADSFW
jgi:hypothetical protein